MSHGRTLLCAAVTLAILAGLTMSYVLDVPFMPSHCRDGDTAVLVSCICEMIFPMQHDPLPTVVTMHGKKEAGYRNFSEIDSGFF
jgi:hypothetical protein